MGIKTKIAELKSNTCRWMDEHPRAALAIKIGVGTAAVAGIGYGCYKIFEKGCIEGASYVTDKLTPSEGSAVSLNFRDNIEGVSQDLWPACMEHLKTGNNEIFFQHDINDVVALFGPVKDTDIPHILEGFIEAGANPDRIAVMLEASVRA